MDLNHNSTDIRSLIQLIMDGLSRPAYTRFVLAMLGSMVRQEPELVAPFRVPELARRRIYQG